MDEIDQVLDESDPEQEDKPLVKPKKGDAPHKEVLQDRRDSHKVRNYSKNPFIPWKLSVSFVKSFLNSISILIQSIRIWFNLWERIKDKTNADVSQEMWFTGGKA